ncbi:aldo/keto reductase [Priestia taiwanensis]|uniref:D-threo-aldose 1-dehydrogenase n=1 Tax=Priestia taiwanensis TaxID=1347902 RepID=A0A917AIN2_9BACI|nr:aldo/keto reductase [Priestia taiwanensis]MBM7361454.1 aryl-alcohol dehydrogenase-like predicted oxidoreductase [Priestia taiwanensis]GGE54250.1 D-threo-aldose 1-dehydrogenase [Priestia taiwanensis]
MQKRKLGHSDLFISEISLGTMSLGTEKEKAISIIDTALDQGINYLDTADLYDYGLNEEFVGEAIKHKRHDIILATKGGNRWTEVQDGWSWDSSKRYLKEAVKSSLRRLQTDYIDLYQLHGGTLDDNIDETIEAFEELTKEGIIRYYGISSIRPNVIREYMKRSSIVSVMMQYNMLDRRPEELFPLFEQHNVSIIARGALAKGLLTSKQKMKPSVQEKGYLTYTPEELAEIVHALTHVQEERPLEETAINYCLANNVVGTVIAGASRNEQIIANVQATTHPLHKGTYERIQAITKQDTYTTHR